jgi:hypothetical protein
MNATIVHKINVKESVLDALARELPAITADTLEVPGGNVALLKPEQIVLKFSHASIRDVGPDINIMIFARKNDTRTSSENALARLIIEKVVELISNSGEEYSVNVRLYLMDIGIASHSLRK